MTTRRRSGRPPAGWELGAPGLALLVALTCSEARADESGGAASPFAQGEGARGLGMGGAFVATADDASVLAWNPGGLSMVSRLAFELRSSRLELSEASRNFGAIVVPDWRWGTVGLAFRHIGVGGIEARDDRDHVLDDDFSAGETEMTAGYGVSVVEGVGVGASVKWQRSAVGTAAGSGFGADLGLVARGDALPGNGARWLAPFTFGAAVRNVVPPSQRLVQDNVTDPRVVRCGVGWRRVLSGAIALQSAAQVDRIAGVSTRWHLGTEVSDGERLSLRAGLAGDRLAAGASVGFGGFAFQYTFEDREGGAIHGIGLTKAIGPTVNDRRAAALRDADRALAERVQREYSQRLGEQVDGVLREARDSMQAGRLTEALDAVRTARALAPENAQAPPLEADILRRTASSQEQAGDLAGAEWSYARAREAFAGDSLAASGQQRVRNALAALANRSRHAAAMSAALELFAHGDLPGARVALVRLNATPLADSTSRALLARIESLLAESARREPLPAPVLRSQPTAAETTRSTAIADAREAERSYRRGLELASAGQTDAALRMWELAYNADRTHAGARAALQREYLLRGMTAFGRGRFGDAEVAWSRAVELDPHDARARSYLDRVRSQMDRTRELTGNDR